MPSEDGGLDAPGEVMTSCGSGSVAGDGPFLPRDLADRLHAAREAAGTRLACARSGGRTHPPIGLWPTALRAALRPLPRRR
jgi:molybdopterin-guanine dinucleotide biosynthesis protein A